MTRVCRSFWQPSSYLVPRGRYECFISAFAFDGRPIGGGNCIAAGGRIIVLPK